MRPRSAYESEAQRRWVSRAESDHWNDAYRWTIEIRTVFQKYEEELKVRSFPTKEECEKRAVEEFTGKMVYEFKKVLIESYLKWDQGLHTWENKKRRP